VIAATTENQPNGFAVKGDSGSESVVNQTSGMLYGNVDLGSGDNQLMNQAGAALYPGQQLRIGDSAQSRLTNQGLLSPGDESIYATEMTGNFDQTRSGQLALNLSFVDDSIDRLNISQDASLEGTTELSTEAVSLIQPGQRQLVFAATDGVITQEELELNVADSAIARYAIGSTDQAAFLELNVDFAGFGELNKNQTAFGNYLNRVQAAGSSAEIAPLIEALFALENTSQLTGPFDSLSPEIYGQLQNNLQLTAQQFTNDLFTCRSNDQQIATAEGQCFWVNGSFQRYDGDRTDEHFGFDTSISLLSAGAQWDLGNDWFIGVAAGISPQETRSTIPADLEGVSTQAGVALKKSLGATNIGLSVVGGLGQFEAERRGIFPTDGQVTSEQDAAFFGSTLRISHDIPLQERWYVRPMLDVGLTRVSYEGFDEKGAGAFNLEVDGDSKAYATLNPAIEFGGAIQSGNVIIRPTVSFGYTRYLSDPSADVSAKLAGAPANIDDFTVSSLADRNIFDTEAGVEFLFQNGLSAKLGYWGQYSKNTSSHGAEFKLNLRF